MNAFFTIIVPTLNEEEYLPNLLKDLSQQTFKDFKVIVVDAKSKDSTQEIAGSYNQLKNKVGVVVSGKKNVSHQRNLGGKNATSEWIVYMDADDRIPKEYLQKIKTYIDAKNPDILSTWIVPDSQSQKDKVIANIMNIFMNINKNSSKPYVLESMIFIKRESFETLKGFNPRIPWGEGGDLLKRARKLGMKFDFLKNPKYEFSFRRLRKIGAFKMLQEVSQMEIIKMVNGGLTKKETTFLYPMNGGSYYKLKKKPKMSLQEFISILFENEKISGKPINLLKKSSNSGKSLFG